MNKTIAQADIERMKRCIIGQGNMMDCSEKTGIHRITINKIIDRKYAKQEVIDKLIKYCDEVEATAANV